MSIYFKENLILIDYATCNVTVKYTVYTVAFQYIEIKPLKKLSESSRLLGISKMIEYFKD